MSDSVKSINGPVENEVTEAIDQGTVERDSDNCERSKEIERLEKLLTDGKRAYIVADLNNAVEILSEAAELSVRLYGDFAAEIFDPHLYYGKTLLDLARMEEDVLSDALKGVVTNDEAETASVEDDETSEGNEVEKLTEEEKEIIAENINKALEENATASDEVSSKEVIRSDEENDAGKIQEKVTENEATEKVDEGDKMDGDKQSGHDDERKSSEELNEETEEQEDADVDATAEEPSNKKESEEEMDQFQLAWETLEVARAVCDRMIDKEGWKERKAEVLVSLGECSIESEEYERAISDFDAAIAIYEQLHTPSDRRKAQALFCKGRAYTLCKQFDNATKAFELSKDVLLTRLAVLNKRAENEKEGECEKIKSEIEELNDIVPEIELKIVDSMESAATMFKVEDKSRANNMNFSANKRDAPVTDVNDLVRKKVKRVAIPLETEAKKVKTSDTVVEAAADSR